MPRSKVPSFAPQPPFNWAKDASELVGVPNVLEHVIIERDFESLKTIVRRKSDRAIVLEISEEEMVSSSRYELLIQMLGTVMCTTCGTPLVANERSQCGGCESTTVMDLIRMEGELR